MGFYDNEVKRVYRKCHRLMILSVNSIFKKNHKEDSEVEFLSEGLPQDGDESFMDMLVRIDDSKYHFEFQLLEGNMAIRMYEYAIKETIVDAGNSKGKDRYVINVVMPRQSVIFLAGANKKDTITVNLTLPDGQEVTYELPCVSASGTVDRLCEEKLYILLPFQQVQLNNRMNRIAKRTEKTKKAIAEEIYDYRRAVKGKIESLVENEDISQEEGEVLLDAFDDVEKYLLHKDDTVNKEVTKKMGDNDYIAHSDRLRMEGRLEGRIEGHREGVDSVVMNALKNGNTPEAVAEFAGLDLEYVLEVEKRMADSDTQ